MKVEPKDNCPLNSFEPCRKFECAWFMQIQGQHPQTGEQFNEWGCSIAWFPILLLENSQQQRQTGAAVESFRNEMVTANEQSQQVLLAAAKITTDPKVIEVK